MIFAPAIKKAQEFEKSMNQTDDLESLSDEPIYEPDREAWPPEDQFVREWVAKFGQTPEYWRQIYREQNGRR